MTGRTGQTASASPTVSRVPDWGASAHPFDITRPHPARLWNLLARGKDHYPIDRQVADLAAEVHPGLAANATHRLAFRARATRHFAQYGLDQFLVVGTDLPTATLQDEVHQIAEHITPGARVVYCDSDPLVLAYARALFTAAKGHVGHVEGDLHDPDRLLIRAASVLDLQRPVGVLLINTLDLLDDQEAESALRRLVSAVAVGSRFAVSYMTDEVNPVQVRGVAEVYRDHHLELRPRTAADVTRLLGSLRLTGTSPVPCSRWHPDEPAWPAPDADHAVDVWCAVAVKEPP